MTKTEKIETADVPLVLNIVSTGVASRNSLSGRNPPRQREFSLLSTKHGLFRCVTYDAECIPLTVYEYVHEPERSPLFASTT